MNLIDFTQTGGFPFDQSTLDFLQNGVLLVQQITNALGNLVILSGCETTGSNVSNGYVVIDGEVLPFVGGVMQSKVVIVQVDTNLTFEDNTPRPVIKTRFATFTDDGLSTYLWENFTRNRLDHVWLTGDIKEVDCTLEYMQANFDNTGLGINERDGWAICNGQNNTRDRRGLMSVQYDQTKPYADALGKTGGEETHVLTKAEMPSNLEITLPLASNDNGVGAFDAGTPGGGNGVYNLGGGGQAHNNMSPYIVTLVIQKIKKNNP